MRQTHHEHQSDSASAGNSADPDRTAEIRQDTRPVWYGPDSGTPDATGSAPSAHDRAPAQGSPSAYGAPSNYGAPSAYGPASNYRAPSAYGAAPYADPAGHGNTTAYGATRHTVPPSPRLGRPRPRHRGKGQSLPSRPNHVAGRN